MIIKGTRCIVMDNTGALEVEIFTIYGGTRKKIGRVGDFVKAAVKKVLPNNKNVKKGEVVRGLIVCTKAGSKNHDGGFSEFVVNGIILLKDNSDEMRGTFVKGRVSRAAFENQNQDIKKILQNCENVC